MPQHPPSSARPHSPARRRLVAGSASLLAGLPLAGLLQVLHSPRAHAQPEAGYGPLQPDPDGILDLPAGFRYRMLSRTGEKMDDGLRVPGLHDGMAAFRAAGGNTLLVRNHEVSPHALELGPGAAPERPAGWYDPAGQGGTTTLEVDAEGRLVRHFLSLGGTVRNCAGGPTPWGSWVSCEETVGVAGERYARTGDTGGGVRVQKFHGYNFEVPAAAPGLVPAVPLTAMGRFNHEAIAVDPRTGIVYQTEDRSDGLLYRFVPRVPGQLAEGGRLEVLRIAGMGSGGVNTTNHPDVAPRLTVGQRLAVEWILVADPDPKEDTLRKEYFERGAASFARGEGIWWNRGAVYFACTSGGPDKMGQIWRLVPSTRPGEPDLLQLFVEVSKGALLQNPDNLCAAPNGDLVVCEDGSGDQHVVGVRRDGGLYPIARNALNRSELAGATFSPDGRILFVNIQTPGITFAIQGPWHR